MPLAVRDGAGDVLRSGSRQRIPPLPTFPEGGGRFDLNNLVGVGGDLGQSILAAVPAAQRPVVEPLIPTIVTSVYEAISLAIASIFWLGVAAGIVGVVAVLVIRELPLRTSLGPAPSAPPVTEPGATGGRGAARAGPAGRAGRAPAPLGARCAPRPGGRVRPGGRLIEDDPVAPTPPPLPQRARREHPSSRPAAAELPPGALEGCRGTSTCSWRTSGGDRRTTIVPPHVRTALARAAPGLRRDSRSTTGLTCARGDRQLPTTGGLEPTASPTRPGRRPAPSRSRSPPA